jgi:hypothetical protein
MKKISITLAIFLIVLGAAVSPVYAAENPVQTFFSSVGNGVQKLYLRFVPGNKSGSAVLNQAMRAMPNLKTSQMKTTIDTDLLKDDQSVSQLNITVQGPMEMHTADTQMTRQDLHVNGEFTMQGTSLRADADFKLVGQTLYFKLNEVPALPSINLTSVTGKWLKTNASSSNATQPETDLQQKVQAASVKLIHSSQAEVARPEYKNGHAVYIVEVTVPQVAIEEFVKTVLEVKPEAMAKSQEQISRLLNQVGDVHATLWIDRGNFFVRHMEMPIQVPVDFSQSSGAGDEAGPAAMLSQVNKVDIKIVMDADHFNEEVHFSEPTDAEDAATAFSGVLGGMMGKSKGLEGTSELPTLTPAQRLQIEQLQKMKTQPQP